MTGSPTDPTIDAGHVIRRIDPFLGTVVHIVESRQSRPNLPEQGCPFCVGGREAPEPYEVRWFPNRWPAMPGDRCEVVLYTPDHDATLGSLGHEGIERVIELWAERTEALGARDDVEFVLVFENRGAEVGATISHPHGQIYAYDHVPHRPARLLASRWRPDPNPGSRTIDLDPDAGAWSAWIPGAPTFPIEVALAPRRRIGRLAQLSAEERSGLASALAQVLEELDRLFDQQLPLMMWILQAPTVADPSAYPGGDEAWLHIEIVSPWRDVGVPRYIAAAEIAGGEYFNPVRPEDLASRLRTRRQQDLATGDLG